MNIYQKLERLGDKRQDLKETCNGLVNFLKMTEEDIEDDQEPFTSKKHLYETLERALFLYLFDDNDNKERNRELIKLLGL